MYEQRFYNFLLSTAAKGEHAVGYVQAVFPKLRGISAHQGRDIVNSMLCAGEVIHTTVIPECGRVCISGFRAFIHGYTMQN